MLSSKNKLQEIFQKKKEQVPDYDTTSSGLSHIPEFMSVIKYNNKVFVGGTRNTKKLAECSAAESLIQYLQQLNCSKKSEYSKPKNFENIILFDLDNICALGYNFSKESHAVGFMSHTSAAYSRLTQYKQTMDVETVKSSVKDATDMLLVVYLAKQIYHKNMPKETPVFIVTKDHFAGALKDIFPIYNINVITSMNDLCDLSLGCSIINC